MKKRKIGNNRCPQCGRKTLSRDRINGEEIVFCDSCSYYRVGGRKTK